MEMNLFKKSKKENLVNKKIFPLSPDDHLEDNSNYSVYKTFLTDALEEKRIHNIAVTGDFGIGKSSLLRTFCNKEDKRFLYLSLSEFNVNSESDEIKLWNDNEKSDFDKQKLECSLLRQLISVCHKKDFPQSHFRMVNETKKQKLNKFVAIVFGLYICVVLSLIFHTQVSEFVHSFFYKGSLHSIHLLMYVFAGLCTAGFLGFGLYKLLMRVKVKEISASLSHSNAEIGATAEIEESVLEKYSFELIYMIESLSRKSKKYDAIVFEDMDRLDSDICIDIFTNLHRINYSVNERLKKKKISFIYVINDSLLALINQTKFFDYILPIYSQLGQGNINHYINMSFDKLGVDAGDKLFFSELARNVTELTDYRTINQIKNEYFVLDAIETNKYGHEEIINYKEKSQILAFSLYKVLFPDDYNLVRAGKSVVLPEFNESEIRKKAIDKPCYRVLIDLHNAGFLTADCVFYFGFSKEEKNRFCECIMKSNVIDAKRNLLKKEVLICMDLYIKNPDERSIYVNNVEDSFMLFFISDSEYNTNLIESFITDYVKPKENKNYTDDEIRIIHKFKSVNIELKIYILKYFIKCKYENFQWLEELIKDNKYKEACFKCLEKFLDDDDFNYIITFVIKSLRTYFATTYNCPKLEEYLLNYI